MNRLIIRYKLDPESARLLRVDPTLAAGFVFESPQFAGRPLRVEMMHKGAVVAAVDIDGAPEPLTEGL
jgi:hypothetical protein